MAQQTYKQRDELEEKEDPVEAILHTLEALDKLLKADQILPITYESLFKSN